jgi:ABC-type uncharacterized transport system permease subunit
MFEKSVSKFPKFLSLAWEVIIIIVLFSICSTVQSLSFFLIENKLLKILLTIPYVINMIILLTTGYYIINSKNSNKSDLYENT